MGAGLALLAGLGVVGAVWFLTDGEDRSEEAPGLDPAAPPRTLETEGGDPAEPPRTLETEGGDPADPARTPGTEGGDPAGERAHGDEGIPGFAPPGERVRVEVLNAGGTPGAAAAVRDELRERGFDVVYWGNAESFGQEETVVLDRSGRVEWARRVAAGVGADDVRSEPDASRLLEVTVLVGSAWEPPAEELLEAEEEEPSTLWRWLRELPGV